MVYDILIICSNCIIIIGYVFLYIKLILSRWKKNSCFHRQYKIIIIKLVIFLKAKNNNNNNNKTTALLVLLFISRGVWVTALVSGRDTMCFSWYKLAVCINNKLVQKPIWGYIEGFQGHLPMAWPPLTSSVKVPMILILALSVGYQNHPS